MDSHYENITKLLGLTQGIGVTIMNHIKTEGGREGEGEREKEGERVCVPVGSDTHIHTIKAESYIAHINIISST